MSPKSLLLLDDDRRFRKALAEDFTGRAYSVTEADRCQEIEGKKFDFAVVDIRLLGESGLIAIPELKKQNPECRIVILSGYGSVATAVNAIKSGAINYLIKPASSNLIEAAFKDELKENFNCKGANIRHIAPLNQHEHEYIEFVLSQNDGNITRTAIHLGLHRQSLQRKLKKKP